MELIIDSGKSEDLQLLLGFLGPKIGHVDIKEKASVADDLPSLKIGNDVIQGTKTIALYLASFEPRLLGETPLEKAEVDQWLTFATTTIKPAISAKNMKATRDFARTVNEMFVQRVFFAAHYLTVADLIIYANLYTYMENLSKKQRFEVCNLSRWFDLLQHTPGVDLKKPLIDIDLDEVAAAPPKKKEDDKAKPEGKKGEPSEGKEKGKEKAKEKGGEKEREKEAKPKEASASAPKGEDEDAAEVDVSRLSLKVGKILEVAKHSGADSLYVEQIDVGEGKPRNVVSGLVKFMTMEEMKDRLVVLVTNMKPAAMRGVTSEAMVLCATSVDGTKSEFVEPPADSKPGDKVFIEGHENGTPDGVLYPKKKVFEKIQPDFKTNDQKVATYKGKPFKTQGGVCTVKTIIGGSIK